MKAWRLVVVVVSAFAVFGLFPGGATAQEPSYYVASDSYYRLNPEAGTIAARVEATVQTGSIPELGEIELVAMPGARDIVVKDGDTVLTTSTEVWPEDGNPILVSVTLASTLRGKLKSDLVMTYTVPAETTEVVKSEAGAIEARFVSQGFGSFVFIDVPVSADNFVEPGCLLVTKQPEDLAAGGYQRFVCGETLVLALFGDRDSTNARCAALDDGCRQRYVTGPYIGYAQSVSDPAKQLKLETTIELAGGTKTLTFKYFRTDRAWAESQFEAAKTALPMLEALFGHPYPFDNITLRQSSLIFVLGIAGVAFTDRGEMLVTNTYGFLDDREVTIHELAHQWAGLTLEQPFAWEGLAEWANYTISPQLGIPTHDRAWESTGYDDPLSSWGATSFVTDPNYWYGRSAAFWGAFETAVGGRANISAVLGQMDDLPRVRDLDSRWFQDRGEEVSGANLDELFLSWVYPREVAAPQLAERRAAHDAVKPLRERAATMLLTGIPKDIQTNLDSWIFTNVAGQVTQATELLDQYAALLARAAEDGGVGAGLGTRWNEMTIAEVRIVLNQMGQALDAIAASKNRLDTGVDDAAGREALVEAREQFLLGNYAEAKALAAGASSLSHNKDAAEKLLTIANERAEAWDPNFLQKIGLWGGDPTDKVAAGQAAYDAGDYKLALDELTGAIDQWSGAQEAGLFRLSLLVFGMFGLVIAGWFLLRRLESKKEPRVPSMRHEGHALSEPGERASSWQEWLNQKDGPRSSGGGGGGGGGGGA
jgi:tetratricopeptide (TPR) repeat protein